MNKVAITAVAILTALLGPLGLGALGLRDAWWQRFFAIEIAFLVLYPIVVAKRSRRAFSAWCLAVIGTGLVALAFETLLSR
jgi:hypothetical protein